MKREYAEEKQDHHHFSKLHHQFQHHSQSQPSPPQLYHPTTESEEADSHSPTQYSKDSLPPPPPPPRSNDGATIEVVRRPRGRPPGSKNKPKPPVLITRDSFDQPSSMSPYVLELPPGVDVIESTIRFCRKRNMGLCVLSGNGVVTDITLKQPSTTPGATVTFHGRFDILSISATILPAGGGLTASTGNGLFTISVAGPQGQMVGGLVVGPLVSAATVYLIASTFSNPSFHKLHQNQVDDNEDSEAARDVGGESTQAVSGAAAESGRVPIYSYQPSDIIWAPTARQPPPPPPPY